VVAPKETGGFVFKPSVMPFLALLPLLFIAACQQPAGDGMATNVSPDTQAHADHAEHAHANSSPEGHEIVSLRVIMQQMSADLAAFTLALWIDDDTMMVARSTAIADHAHMAPEDVRRIQASLGSDMVHFEAADEAVHHTARRLREAAEASDRNRILTELAQLQSGCVSCHTQFRERITGGVSR
jgi:cytochrome c556